MKKRTVLALVVVVLALSFSGCSLWRVMFPDDIVDGWQLTAPFPLGVNTLHVKMSGDGQVVGYVRYDAGYGPYADPYAEVYVITGTWSPSAVIWTVQGAGLEDSLTWGVTGDTLTMTGAIAGQGPYTLVFERTGT